ncbi:ribonuclease 3-like protein 3 [Rhodamnia argentea]|uniref:Ribonuclease 3-like protein 3 n=1 Tax=Rhodamnia argentea TaxID=178133 RepID=A0ABM3H6F5_9MYRT|nr:ribonuclease 3-like protein 3 [Rhodamnia argentea]
MGIVLRDNAGDTGINTRGDRRCCYETLEYDGDSVLNLLFAKELYFLHPDLALGSLTRLRAANVDTEKLAHVAIKLRLHRYVQHRKSVFEEQVSFIFQSIGLVFIDCNSSVDTIWKTQIVYVSGQACAILELL